MRLAGPGMLVCVALSVLTASPAHAGQRETGRILVSLDDMRTADAVLAAAGAVADGPRVPQIGLVTARPALRLTRARVLEKLREDARVRAVSVEGRFDLRFRPNDPALRVAEPDPEAPPGSVLQWAAERHGLLRAWDITRGDGARVAIIDTGVETDHPDLAGKILTAIDLDGGADGDATEDQDGHGTHVASLACAASDNGIGIAGAGYDCSLIVIKTDLTDASVAASIVVAADRGAHAINMSFGDDGSSKSQGVADAIEYAVKRGAVVVAAAADEPIEEQGEPANLLQPSDTSEQVQTGLGLSVTAADSRDRRASFAGRGGQISMAAYGALHSDKGVRGLFAAYPQSLTDRETSTMLGPCDCRTSLDGDERWAYLSGTSMSSPQVAAVAAMIRRMNPTVPPLEVVQLLKETARRPGGGWEPELGWGILDAGAAVEKARAIDRRAPVSQPRLRLRGRTVSVSWTASDPVRGPLLASGVASVDIYVARDGRWPQRIARKGAKGKLHYRLRRGHVYSFHTEAVDRAGNRESAPRRPDARVAL